MAEIIWTLPALQDLDAIADYISLDKPEAARSLVQRVFEHVAQLVDYPESGSVPKELKGMSYRRLVIPPLRIFYRCGGPKVYIVYVMRAEQMLSPDLLRARQD